MSIILNPQCLIIIWIHSIYVTVADDYVAPALVPMEAETHGGEDVAIYANGPMSHMFRGVVEQNYIAHVMAYASCVGEYTSCEWMDEDGGGDGGDCPSSAVRHHSVYCLAIIFAVFVAWLQHGFICLVHYC